MSKSIILIDNRFFIKPSKSMGVRPPSCFQDNVNVSSTGSFTAACSPGTMGRERIRYTSSVNAITYPATNRLSSNTFMRLLEAYKKLRDILSKVSRPFNILPQTEDRAYSIIYVKSTNFQNSMIARSSSFEYLGKLANNVITIVAT